MGWMKGLYHDLMSARAISRGKYETAIWHARQNDSSDWDKQNEVVRIWLHAGQLEKVEELLEQARQTNSYHYSDIHLHALVEAYEAQGNHRRAMLVWAKHYEWRQSEPSAARYYLKASMPEKAIEMVRRLEPPTRRGPLLGSYFELDDLKLMQQEGILADAVQHFISKAIDQDGLPKQLEQIGEYGLAGLFHRAFGREDEAWPALAKAGLKVEAADCLIVDWLREAHTVGWRWYLVHEAFELSILDEFMIRFMQDRRTHPASLVEELWNWGYTKVPFDYPKRDKEKLAFDAWKNSGGPYRMLKAIRHAYLQRPRTRELDADLDELESHLGRTSLGSVAERADWLRMIAGYRQERGDIARAESLRRESGALGAA